MAIEKEGKVIKWINTIMLSLITAGIIWSGKTLLLIKEVMDKQVVKNVVYETLFAELKIYITDAQKENREQQKTIDYLEAILPEKLRLKKQK